MAQQVQSFNWAHVLGYTVEYRAIYLRLDQHWKEYEVKYDFSSTCSPTIKQRPEHDAAKAMGVVEDPEI